MSEYQITDSKILENFNKGKFLKKDLRKVFKEMCKAFGCNTRGYKEIDLLAKKNADESITFVHIGQWTEEKVNNTFDYDLMIFDAQGHLTYDESNGELKKFKCYQVFEDSNRLKHYPIYD